MKLQIVVRLSINGFNVTESINMDGRAVMKWINFEEEGKHYYLHVRLEDRFQSGEVIDSGDIWLLPLGVIDRLLEPGEWTTEKLEVPELTPNTTYLVSKSAASELMEGWFKDPNRSMSILTRKFWEPAFTDTGERSWI